MYIPLTFEAGFSKCLFASGGYEGYFISGSQQYKYHWFTGSAQLVVQKGTIDKADIYVIGGGGGGAAGVQNVITAGGGGGGGVATSLDTQLFGGTYYVTVGRGGGGAGASNNPGASGLNSSFVGSNKNIVAGGGGGGNYSSGNRGGTSGNGFLGGLNANGNGGGGGGATAVGVDGTSLKAGDGGSGVAINFDDYNWGFGCGGGGYAPSNTDTQGFSCNDASVGAGGRGNNGPSNGANKYGQGGGAGGAYGGAGGSGSVIIQYPIYDYCTNYFNETGSCGCNQVTFDPTDIVPSQFAYYYLTGSYIYMPCGQNQFASGSLYGFSPITVCAVSNSYLSTAWKFASDTNPTVRAGFANFGTQCVSQSLAPTTCSIESFVPTCTSSIVTIYTPSASAGTPNDFYYVPKNATTHTEVTSTTDQVKYYCISTGSLYGTGVDPYPKLLNGTGTAFYDGASCNTITLVASWAGIPSGNGSSTYYYYACNGVRTSVSFVRPTTGFTGALSASFCRDMKTPAFFERTGTRPPNESLTTGASCLNDYFDTGSCGCP